MGAGWLAMILNSFNQNGVQGKELPGYIYLHLSRWIGWKCDGIAYLFCESKSPLGVRLLKCCFLSGHEKGQHWSIWLCWSSNKKIKNSCGYHLTKKLSDLSSSKEATKNLTTATLLPAFEPVIVQLCGEKTGRFRARPGDVAGLEPMVSPCKCLVLYDVHGDLNIRFFTCFLHMIHMIYLYDICTYCFSW